MFGKEKDGADQAGSGATDHAADTRKSNSQSSAAPSIISADMKVVGDLQSGGDIQIEGSVEGDIKSRTVTIGEKAHINGSVNADTTNILGRINGEINASVVRIAKSANVQGDIIYQTLSIEDGAVIDGKIKRKDSAGTKSDAAPKSAASGSTADANVASIKPSVASGDGKSSDAVSASSSGAPGGGKPLAR
jgi:cytoskeletal protein CcmA (bactofilin family)